MWENTVRRERTCINLWDSLCMINVYDGPMETAMLNICGWTFIIIKCFKRFLSNIHLVKKNVLTVEKKCLLLVIPYLGIIPLEIIVLPYLVIIPLEIRKKCNQVLKGFLNCCKLKIAFKCQTRVSNSLRHKNPILKDHISGVVYKF